MNKSCIVLKHNQRGATLVLALLILVILIIYGVPAAMNSIQNERMASNTRQRDLAFQTAETAIRYAENNWIYDAGNSVQLPTKAPYTVTTCLSGSPPSGGNTDPDTTDCFLVDGHCHQNDNAYWQSYNWVAASICVVPGSSNSRFIIERLPDAEHCQSGAAAPCTSPDFIRTDLTERYYRVTARGLGQDNSTIVILQTIYKFKS